MLNKITKSIFVIFILLQINNVRIGIACTFFDTFTSKYRLLLLPFLFMERLNLLLLVIKLVLLFYFNLDSVVVVYSISSFLSIL